MKPHFDLSFYLVLDPVLCGGVEGMVQTVRAACSCGVTMVQLRDKQAATASLIDTASHLQAALKGSNTRLIINDDVEAAIAIGADGVHIGQEDMAVGEARRRIGPEMILGLSVETAELAARAQPQLVDYVGVGPVFSTPTKPDHKTPIGFNGLAQLVALSKVPAVAIGGLKAQHVADVFASGAQGISVVSAICGKKNPQTHAHLIKQAIERIKA